MHKPTCPDQQLLGPCDALVAARGEHDITLRTLHASRARSRIPGRPEPSVRGAFDRRNALRAASALHGVRIELSRYARRLQGKVGQRRRIVVTLAEFARDGDDTEGQDIERCFHCVLTW